MEDEEYNKNINGTEEEGKYKQDPTTGLWVEAVTESVCNASDGFICNVMLNLTIK